MIPLSSGVRSSEVYKICISHNLRIVLSKSAYHTEDIPSTVHLSEVVAIYRRRGTQREHDRRDGSELVVQPTSIVHVGRLHSQLQACETDVVEIDVVGKR